MNVIHSAAQWTARPRKVCLAIGMFDGVHLGHQQVLRHTVEDARQHEATPVAVTFDRHPNSVVAPGRIPPLIYTLPQKLRAVGASGVATTLLIRFDREFSEKPADVFIRELACDFRAIHGLCVGSAFVFGHKRNGNVELLQRLGNELQFTVHGIAAVSLGGKVVSSTRIREAIRGGDLDTASQMLGRAYALSGRVTRGDRLGREIGFPTANIDVTGLALPPNGVYAVRGLMRSQWQRGVVNIGTRPTLGQPTPRLQVEVHFLDFSQDIYEQEMEIVFLKRLRDERQFPSRDALRRQIQLDIEAARAVF